MKHTLLHPNILIPSLIHLCVGVCTHIILVYVYKYLTQCRDYCSCIPLLKVSYDLLQTNIPVGSLVLMASIINTELKRVPLVNFNKIWSSSLHYQGETHSHPVQTQWRVNFDSPLKFSSIISWYIFATNSYQRGTETKNYRSTNCSKKTV